MEEAYKILAVDDEPINREILLSSLEEHYTIRCVSDGESCLNVLDDWQPDIILMDVNMPGMNGLDTCKLIKTNSQLAELPIIFISDLSSPDERLAGYMAGGIDYITKPFVPNELIAKINISLSHKQKVESAREKTRMVRLTARTAVDAAVESSHVLRFLRQCLACETLPKLIDHFFDAISEYKLHAVAEIHSNIKNFTQSNTGSVNTLEIGLLRKMADKGRVFSFGKRAVYNRENISLLILDLPSEDNYKSERLLDHIELIVDAASYAINNLLNVESMQEKHKQLNSRLTTTAKNLAQLKILQGENESEHTTMIKTLMIKISETLVQFGLESEHEQQLFSLIENIVQENFALHDTDVLISSKLTSILLQLESSA